MALIGLATLNYAAAGLATLSGGSWLAARPLADLQQRSLSRVARTANLATSSTQFDADLGRARNIGLVGLLRHNCTTLAQFRVRAADTSAALASAPLFDSGWLDVWPTAYLPEQLEWEDDNWWSGVISDEQRVGYPINLLSSFTLVKAQFWRVEFNDPTNAAGYLEFARVWFGPVWQPQRNMSRGYSLVYEARGEVEESLGGAEYFDEKPSRRVFRFALPALSDAEAFGTVLDLQRRLGVTGEIIVLPDIDDTARRHIREFYGRIRQLDPVTQAAFNLHGTGFEIQESIA